MAVKTTFHGKFYYYENINGKQKKVEKDFTDKKKYDAFMKKHPMPSLSSFFGLSAPKKALSSPKKAAPVKKTCKRSTGKKASIVKKKK